MCVAIFCPLTLSSQEGLRGFEFGWRDAPCPWHALGHALRAARSPGGLGGLGARRLGLWRRRTGRLHPDSRSRTGLVKRNASFTSPRWSRSCHGGAPYLCSGRANLRGHSGHRFLRASWFHPLFCQSTGLFLPKEMLKETAAIIRKRKNQQESRTPVFPPRTNGLKWVRRLSQIETIRAHSKISNPS